MKYYELSIVEGVYEDDYTVAYLPDDYNYDSNDSVHKICYEKEIKIKPNLDFVIIGKGKLCDVYTNPSGMDDTNSLYVSTRLYSILTTLNLPKHQVLKVKAKYKKETLNYYFIHFLENVFSIKHLVDFEKTIFYSKARDLPHLPPPTGLIGEFKISTWDEFTDIRREVCNAFEAKYIDPIKLYVKQKSFFALDFIYIDLWNSYDYFIISEKLASQLKKENIIGVNIEELPYEIILSET